MVLHKFIIYKVEKKLTVNCLSKVRKRCFLLLWTKVWYTKYRKTVLKVFYKDYKNLSNPPIMPIWQIGPQRSVIANKNYYYKWWMWQVWEMRMDIWQDNFIYVVYSSPGISITYLPHYILKKVQNLEEI